MLSMGESVMKFKLKRAHGAGVPCDKAMRLDILAIRDDLLAPGD